MHFGTVENQLRGDSTIAVEKTTSARMTTKERKRERETKRTINNVNMHIKSFTIPASPSIARTAVTNNREKNNHQMSDGKFNLIMKNAFT